MKKYFLIFFLIGFIKINAQFPKVEIPGSEVRKITSSIVTGQEYELHILLPGNYKKSTKKFPVVYLMDSQWDFPVVKSIYGQQYFDGFIPELIVVGVTWGGINPNPDSLRARDYTPTKEGKLPQSGGADNFLSFMKNELFPFIETNYKADNANRTLMGCSLGGLISLYTLFTQPELFTGYAAASPAIGWDGEVLRKYEMEFAKKKLTHPVRVYMTIGEVERSRPAYEKFAADIKSKNYSSATIYSGVLLNTGHSGTKSETFGRGLQFIFEKPNLKLDENILQKYTGVYKAESGNTFEIKSTGNQLNLFFSANNRYPLYIASETEFYSNAEFMNLLFKITNNKIEGVELEQYGRSRFFTKTQ